MPLIKNGASAPQTTAAVVVGQEANQPSALQSHANRLGGTHKVGDKAATPMTKDGYWERKEARDIETGIRIRRSGVWQAALQSVGVLQYNLDGSLEGFLAVVEKAAQAGLAFVNKD
jgi:hypothetical protein